MQLGRQYDGQKGDQKKARIGDFSVIVKLQTRRARRHLASPSPVKTGATAKLTTDPGIQK